MIDVFVVLRDLLRLLLTLYVIVFGLNCWLLLADLVDLLTGSLFVC